MRWKRIKEFLFSDESGQDKELLEEFGGKYEVKYSSILDAVHSCYQEAKESQDHSRIHDIKECLRVIHVAYSRKDDQGYEKHLERHGFQGCSGSEAEEKYKTYIENLKLGLQLQINKYSCDGFYNTHGDHYTKTVYRGVLWGRMFIPDHESEPEYHKNNKCISKEEYENALANDYYKNDDE